MNKMTKKLTRGNWWLVYFGFTVFVGILGFLKQPQLRLLWPQLWLDGFTLIGGFVGFHFRVFEKLVRIYYLNKQDNLSVTVRQSLKQDRRQFIRYLFDETFLVPKRPIIGSFLFQVAWLILALFTLTSSSSYFGKGLVMGLGLDLLLTSWQFYLVSWETYRDRTFWLVSRSLSFQEVKNYLWVWSALFVVLSVIFI
jgi:hypothetical protein